MSTEELAALLDRLIAGGETEVVEFKEAANQYSADKTGEYVSALSNEANLDGADYAWMVFGVSNNLKVVGTAHLADPAKRQALKHHIQQSIDQGLTVSEIYETEYQGHRVVLLQIPAAPRGIPISWKGDYRARAGESLVPLSLDKLDSIRNQTIETDWTAVVVPEATLNDLDPEAIRRARLGFRDRHSSRIPAEVIDAWDDALFLDKARLTRDGKITRATLLLLGKEISAHLLTPHPAQMTWNLVGEQPGYEHFYTPFLLSATALSKRIRNVQMRLLPPDELIYREISKYDERSILEALYNCVAHQDYTQRSRIIVTERVDRVEFISVGEFYDGNPDDYILEKRTPRKYRNTFLLNAMTGLNLIDQLGYGIHRMAQDQVRRFLPLPDYDLSDNEVKLSIPGAVIDENFSRMLMMNTDIPLEDILALDRIQKKLPIPEKTIKHFQRMKLIEGRKPNYRVAPVIAAATGDQATYIHSRGQDDSHYIGLIVSYIEKFGGATRGEIERLLDGKLSDDLTEQQRKNKIDNLLRKMRFDGIIAFNEPRNKARWILAKD